MAPKGKGKATAKALAPSQSAFFYTLDSFHDLVFSSLEEPIIDNSNDESDSEIDSKYRGFEEDEDEDKEAKEDILFLQLELNKNRNKELWVDSNGYIHCGTQPLKPKPFIRAILTS
jgi:hypothetical protein